MENTNCPLCKKSKCACSTQKNENLPQITAEELHKKLSIKDGLLLVNVLPSTHYDDCHIPHSINIPFDQLKEQAATLDRNKPIVVYCASYMCTASKGAFELLHTMGFNNVLVYEGGTKEWREKGFPTEGPCSLPYLKNET